MPEAQHITRTGQFLATVAGLRSLSPRMRRIVLAAPEIAGRSWPLGCDIAVVLAGPDGREVRRRYTVRSRTGEELVVDAVLHGHGPGSSWAESLRPGDQVSFFGPRGELPVPAESSAAWLLALTDEAGLPAIGALAEALEPAGRSLRVVAEIADDGERYPLPANAEVRWLARDGRPAGRTCWSRRSGRSSPAPARASATCWASPGRSSRCATRWPGGDSAGPRCTPRGTGT